MQRGDTGCTVRGWGVGDAGMRGCGGAGLLGELGMQGCGGVRGYGVAGVRGEAPVCVCV